MLAVAEKLIFKLLFFLSFPSAFLHRPFVPPAIFSLPA